MKKVLFILILFIPSYQAIAIGGFTFDFGFKYGVNSSKLATALPASGLSTYTLSDFRSEAKSGYEAGVFLRLGGNRVYLQPELLYCHTNGKTIFTVSNQDEVQNLQLKSWKVPMLLGFKVLNLKVASLRIVTGPSLSLNTAGSSIGTDLNNLVKLNPESFKPQHWDYLAGVGIDILKFTLDARYGWGISALTSTGTVSSPSLANKGNTFTISLGFKLF